MRTFGIVVAVNKPPGQAPLRNAENDAADVAAVLRGEHGPVAGADILDLIGASATTGELDEAFRLAALARPDVLFLMLSGHGNTTGVCLRDGIYAFSTLSARIQTVGAQHVAVIVDTCHAGSFANHIGGSAATTDILESAVRKCGTTAFPRNPARAPAGREAGRRRRIEASG